MFIEEDKSNSSESTEEDVSLNEISYLNNINILFTGSRDSICSTSIWLYVHVLITN